MLSFTCSDFNILPLPCFLKLAMQEAYVSLFDLTTCSCFSDIGLDDDDDDADDDGAMKVMMCRK